ncbi:hypothetical protein MMC26_006425 [Xylographa opegraphella]|nr:hypothetical protein [Xylographa opegraphella]
MVFTVSFHRVLVLLAVTLSINLHQLQVSAEPLRYDLHRRHFVPTAAQCASHITLLTNTALFWSGTGKHAKFARGNGLYNMDKAYGEWINPTNKNSPLGTTAALDRIVEQPIWDALSLAMAVAAKGTVYVMKGPNAEAKTASTWNRVEFPALKANHAVTSIVGLPN